MNKPTQTMEVWPGEETSQEPIILRGPGGSYLHAVDPDEGIGVIGWMAACFILSILALAWWALS